MNSAPPLSSPPRPGRVIQIACSADEAYAPHCAAMLHSLISHVPPKEVCIHFLHGPSLPTDFTGRLAHMVEGWGAAIRFHRIEDVQVEGLPVMGRISRIMWYRVLLPQLLPDADKVLYLDCDMIVMDDLRKLYDEPLEDAYLGAVTNVFDHGMSHRARAVGLDSPSQYFNSGLLLMNLVAWRRDHCAEEILAYARAHATELLWPDQDALNAVLARRRRVLDPRWNCQNSFYYFAHAESALGRQAVRAARRQPGILHFEGPEFCKPWHYLCKHPFRESYFRHLAATPWPPPVLQGRTFANRILRWLPLRALPPVVRFVRRLDAALQRRLRQRGWGQ